MTIIDRVKTIAFAHEALGQPPATQEALSRHFEREMAEEHAPSISVVMQAYSRCRAERKAQLSRGTS